MGEHYLRPADRDDIDAIVALERRCFVEPWPPIAFAQFIGAHGFLLAVDPNGEAAISLDPVDGTLAGYVVVTPAMRAPDRVAHLRNLAVAPGYRRRGIGRELMAAAVARYPADRFERIRLEVRASNAAAIELYRTEGYAVSGRIPGYYADGEAALVMERRLEGAREG